jgi:hypothetical protein
MYFLRLLKHWPLTSWATFALACLAFLFSSNIQYDDGSLYSFFAIIWPIWAPMFYLPHESSFGIFSNKIHIIFTLITGYSIAIILDIMFKILNKANKKNGYSKIKFSAP